MSALITSLEENVVRTTLLEPRGAAALADLDIHSYISEVCIGIVDHLAVAKVAIEGVGELPERLGFGVTEG